ncbi:MAG: hypothetical protein QM831_23525 [Kofleriaceae bacterium]
MDATVRSIQVASALLDRVAVLMGDGQVGARVGGTKADEMDLRIGEAQQTMPEVWAHLGEARDAIAASGGDVAAYDAIRATVTSDKASQDVSESIHKKWNGKTETVKAVTWDRESFDKAKAARDVLRKLRADVDWAAIEREEAAELAAVGGLRGPTWKRVVYVGGFVIVAGAVIYALSFIK